jgi:hypothetical protein
MTKNSRYYYKRYLDEAITHFDAVDERLRQAYQLIEDDEHLDIKEFLMVFGKGVRDAREILADHNSQM